MLLFIPHEFVECDIVRWVDIVVYFAVGAVQTTRRGFLESALGGHEYRVQRVEVLQDLGFRFVHLNCEVSQMAAGLLSQTPTIVILMTPSSSLV